MKFIVLDSTPLGLLFTKVGHREGDECREWLKRHLAAGIRFIVPEIVDYELRRELLRIGNPRPLAHLDTFIAAEQDRYLPITTRAMRLASAMWAQARRQGVPTADPHALDVDVILSAQVLTGAHDLADTVVATSNLAHLSQFVTAKLWQTI